MATKKRNAEYCIEIDGRSIPNDKAVLSAEQAKEVINKFLVDNRTCNAVAGVLTMKVKIYTVEK